ncbi:hypothetical protein LG047_06695 [Methylocystis sp. WRRC1]|uniref:hypothetical protein n=1 Tax=Methylocystis sp. WRRC1 TaxID=1732014 RepID=UPI001D150666|nr:hypothetical protein [Methylocystis sp. WRRC1]MCC3245012.1 hypothetical protein [Methylocystis sp. WRRC1]
MFLMQVFEYLSPYFPVCDAGRRKRRPCLPSNALVGVEAVGKQTRPLRSQGEIARRARQQASDLVLIKGEPAFPKRSILFPVAPDGAGHEMGKESVAMAFGRNPDRFATGFIGDEWRAFRHWHFKSEDIDFGV